MKIYTKTGDRGDTGLFGGARVSKSSTRVESYGDVDELNSVLGVCRMATRGDAMDSLLEAIQGDLFTVGAELATVPGKEGALTITLISDADVERLEHAIDDAETELAPLKTFVLPGGGPAGAYLHLARAVCRRAERHVVALASAEPVRGELVRYLNRLADLLFVLARLANHRASLPDTPWHGGRR